MNLSKPRGKASFLKKRQKWRTRKTISIWIETTTAGETELTPPAGIRGFVFLTWRALRDSIRKLGLDREI